MCVQASDGCREEIINLSQQEKILKTQLQQQEALLRRLQLLNQASSQNNVVSDQNQDTHHSGWEHKVPKAKRTFNQEQTHKLTKSHTKFCDSQNVFDHFNLCHKFFQI